MKRTLVGVVAATALLLGGGQVVALADPADEVSIPDAALRGCVNSHLGGSREPDAAVTEAEMETLTSLNCNDWVPAIENLTGLEHAANLASLFARRNAISDLSPLSNLSALTHLNLDGNQISDLSPLSSLTSLEQLFVGGQAVAAPAAVVGVPAPNPVKNIAGGAVWLSDFCVSSVGCALLIYPAAGDAVPLTWDVDGSGQQPLLYFSGTLTRDVRAAFKVTFAPGNGAEGSPFTEDVADGDTLTLPGAPADFQKDGYKFTGWRDEAAAEPTLLQAGSAFTPVGDTTLTAQWEKLAEIFVVSFDAGGGEGAPAPIAVAEGDAVTIPSAVPTRDGYKFLGWKDPSAMGSAMLRPGAEYIPPFSVVLLAQWEKLAEPLVVSFDAGGGEGAPAPIAVAEGDAMTIPSTVPTRDGYKFLGWKDPSAMGSAMLRPGAEYIPPFSVVLLAQWEKVTAGGGNADSGATGAATGVLATTGADLLPLLAGSLVLTGVGVGVFAATRIRARG